MKFDKYQAAGNDFIIINGLVEHDENYNDLALKICDRHFGIGADGLMICVRSNVSDIKMIYYNSDGSQGEMCGNGIRSFSKYIYDHKIVEKKSISIETLAGIKYVYLEVDGEDNVENIKVDMGYPIFEPLKIPVDIEKNGVFEEELDIEGETYTYSALKVGVPHAVIFVENIDDYDINNLGGKIERHGTFPQNINVDFVEVIDRDNIEIYTWERGAGRTLGCGTGSCASVVIGKRLDLLNNSVKVKTEGGNLSIELRDDEKIYMIGNAVHIANGHFLL